MLVNNALIYAVTTDSGGDYFLFSCGISMKNGISFDALFGHGLEHDDVMKMYWLGDTDIGVNNKDAEQIRRL